MSKTSHLFFCKNLLLLFVLLSLSACATPRKPLTGLVPGREVETLASSVNISAKSGEQSTSGRGYLLFKRPDRFHVAIVNPFGLSVLEVFGSGDRLSYLVPSKQVAYTGFLSELPETSALTSLGMMQWVVASPASPEVAPPGSREFTTAAGERYYLDENGLVERKVSPLGDEVTYRNYRNVGGVAFPESIVIASRFGGTLKIVFEEPEINQPVEEDSLVPNLEGYQLFPLALLRGM